MGTNFFIGRRDEDSGRLIEVEHVGLSAAGWTFLFRGSRYRSVREWRDRLDNLSPGEGMYDEYGRAVSLQAFWSLILVKVTIMKQHRLDDRIWEDAGCEFAEHEFS